MANNNQNILDELLANCHSVKDLHIEIKERIEKLNEFVDAGDASDAADAAEGLAAILRAIADEGGAK